uniref:Uncharacterized protein n=1 Tax=Setaria viridis TaxID=4556 RepID=A0A4U6VIJ9_SETVI|nr:hypothetical protein SEVIR_3G247333v2 [Setaria viridis]
MSVSARMELLFIAGTCLASSVASMQAGDDYSYSACLIHLLRLERISKPIGVLYFNVYYRRF